MLAMLGCANTGYSARVTPQYAPRLDFATLYAACRREGCREPNAVVAHYFSVIARNNGVACIVHILPPDSAPPWAYWDQYVHYLRGLLRRGRLQFYAYIPKRGTNAEQRQRARLNLERLGHLYHHYGALRGYMTQTVVTEKSAVLPPYREPYCQRGPVLEIYEGARIVSNLASAMAERIRASDRAARTYIVVWQARYGENR